MQSGDSAEPDASAPEKDHSHKHQTKDEEAKDNQPTSQWAFHAEDASESSNTGDDIERAPVRPVSWTASEYVAHDKNIGWFLVLSVVIALLTGLMYLITQEILPPVATLILGIAFGVFAARQPQVLEFAVDEKGLQAGNKFYGYDKFKSFSIIEEDATRSILLIPLQRFMPPISVFYDPADEEKILDVLGNYLPYEQRNNDIIDRFMRKIRF